MKGGAELLRCSIWNYQLVTSYGSPGTGDWPWRKYEEAICVKNKILMGTVLAEVSSLYPSNSPDYNYHQHLFFIILATDLIQNSLLITINEMLLVIYVNFLKLLVLV